MEGEPGGAELFEKRRNGRPFTVSAVSDKLTRGDCRVKHMNYAQIYPLVREPYWQLRKNLATTRSLRA